MLGMEMGCGKSEVPSIELSTLVRNHLPTSMGAIATTTSNTLIKHLIMLIQDPTRITPDHVHSCAVYHLRRRLAERLRVFSRQQRSTKAIFLYHPITSRRCPKPNHPAVQTLTPPKSKPSLPRNRYCLTQVFIFPNTLSLQQGKKLWWCSGYHIQRIFGTWHKLSSDKAYREGRRFESCPRSFPACG
jgi:hypothetical protein